MGRNTSESRAVRLKRRVHKSQRAWQERLRDKLGGWGRGILRERNRQNARTRKQWESFYLIGKVGHEREKTSSGGPSGCPYGHIPRRIQKVTQLIHDCRELFMKAARRGHKHNRKLWSLVNGKG